MTILHTLLWNLLAPAIVSASAIALGRRIGRSFPGGRRGRWGVAAGMGLGYLVGHSGLLGMPGFPPIGAKERVAWLALGAGVVGLVEATWTLPRRSSWAVRGLFVAGLLGVLLRSKVERGWAGPEAAVWLAGLWVAVHDLVVEPGGAGRSAHRAGVGHPTRRGRRRLGGGAEHYSPGAASLGQPSTACWRRTLLGALPTVGLRPGLTLSKGGPAVATTVLAGLGLTGYFYSEVPASSALLLALAPWTPWVDRIGFIRRRSYWTRASVRFLGPSSLQSARRSFSPRPPHRPDSTPRAVSSPPANCLGLFPRAGDFRHQSGRFPRP